MKPGTLVKLHRIRSTMADPELLARMRKGILAHARFHAERGLSVSEWEEMVSTDPIALVLGARAVTAVSALIWNWGVRR